MRMPARAAWLSLILIAAPLESGALDVSLEQRVLAEWNFAGGLPLLYNGVSSPLILGWDVGNGISVIGALEPGFSGYGLFSVLFKGGAAWEILRAGDYALDLAGFLGAGPSYYVFGNGLHLVLSLDVLVRQRWYLSPSAFCFISTGLSLSGTAEAAGWYWSANLPLGAGIGFTLP